MFKGINLSKYLNIELNKKVYDVVHIICFFGMLFACFLINFFFDNKNPVYVAFGISLLFLVTMIIGDILDKKNVCAIIMSIIFNFFFMPYIFVSYGKFVCVIPFYFLFGVVYTIFVLDFKCAFFLSIFESVFYTVFIIIFRSRVSVNYNELSDSEFRMVYYATIAAFILVTVCLGISVRVKYLMYINEKGKADVLHEQTVQEYISKEMFLINISHEIRTPMNAIVGNANLLLDEDIDNKIRDNVYHILNSCNALLLILNELMDLAKIEGKNIEIFDDTYDLREMITEVSNMISIKLMESNLNFFVDVNREIPRYLKGDVAKIRQILINIINNAIRFTDNGEITLRVNYEPESNNKLNLKIEVIDTGIGVNEFDQKIMFSDSADGDNNSKSGLAICKRILDKMGGSIAVESKINEGSKFSVCIPQTYNDEETVAAKINNDLNVLVVESNELLAEKIKKTMNDMGIMCDTAISRVELDSLIQAGNYTHIFLAFSKFDECDVTLQRRVTNEKIIIISDIGESVDASLVSSTIIRPLYSVNIASALNNEEDSSVYNKSRKNDFIIPNVNILVVDDNYTNLDVASALLKKYEANVMVASCGADAIRILEENNIDIVFMDYMMPELNGIDTLNLIRKMPDEKFLKLPVVALSANVISGAYEMFMQAGFDAFIAKPINVSKLEKTLRELLNPNFFEELR